MTRWSIVTALGAFAVVGPEGVPLPPTAEAVTVTRKESSDLAARRTEGTIESMARRQVDPKHDTPIAVEVNFHGRSTSMTVSEAIGDTLTRREVEFLRSGHGRSETVRAEIVAFHDGAMAVTPSKNLEQWWPRHALLSISDRPAGFQGPVTLLAFVGFGVIVSCTCATCYAAANGWRQGVLARICFGRDPCCEEQQPQGSMPHTPKEEGKVEGTSKKQQGNEHWHLRTHVANELVGKRHRVWKWVTEAECESLKVQLLPKEGSELQGFKRVQTAATEASVQALLGKNMNLDLHKYLPYIVNKLDVNECYFVAKSSSSEVVLVHEAVLICISFGGRILLHGSASSAAGSSGEPPRAASLAQASADAIRATFSGSGVAGLPIVELRRRELPKSAACRLWAQLFRTPPKDPHRHFGVHKQIIREHNDIPGLRHVERLRVVTVQLSAADAAVMTQLGASLQDPFTTTDAAVDGNDGSTKRTQQWTWAPPDEFDAIADAQGIRAALPEICWQTSLQSATSSSTEILEKLLHQYDVDTSSWTGQGKHLTVDDLCKQLIAGHASLWDGGGARGKKLLRVERSLQLRMWNDDANHLLLQVGCDDSADSVFSTIDAQLPERHWFCSDSLLETGRLLVKESFQLDEDEVEFSNTGNFEYDEQTIVESPSFPGIATLRMDHYVDCRLSSEEHSAERIGLDVLYGR